MFKALTHKESVNITAFCSLVFQIRFTAAITAQASAMKMLVSGFRTSDSENVGPIAA